MNDVEQTIGKLAGELAALGVQADQNLLVHTSLRRVGQIPGGPASLLAALRRVAGRHATVVVPTETTGNSLSSRVFRAATAGFGRAELRKFIEVMPGFDPASTPSAGMGVFAEYVRTLPGAVRSAHPQSSFAAVGPCAEDCTVDHELACHLGERSPLGWLYRSGAAILLLGVGYEACTAFHLAEYRLLARA
jgi:aminoglycoside 3-N-acetyltransferase